MQTHSPLSSFKTTGTYYAAPILTSAAFPVISLGDILPSKPLGSGMVLYKFTSSVPNVSYKFDFVGKFSSLCLPN